MSEPIEVQLKSDVQIAMARLQDSVLEAALEIDIGIILHGGTSIWRCYNGNRFSEDIDIYANDLQARKIKNTLTWALSKRGINLEYPNYTNMIFTASSNSSMVKLEIMKPKSGINTTQKEYLRANGSRLIVTTLPVKDLIKEKIDAYISRKYVRDLYDIYHLASIESLDGKCSEMLKEFIKHVESPVDQGKLEDLIYSGISPSFDTMVDYIKSRLK
ncbi:MAG: nucleotidyl transferase AbiEii/AbiGii toxin family protein [Candidatus Micrarchaeaceae archaeon]|jgi:predicted nucleotidyltransferase component of viral defense system